MRHAFFLAARYLTASPVRTAVLVVCSAIALYLPVATYFASELLSEDLRSRGKSTPILIGSRGNEFDLTMNSLYFRGQIGQSIPMSVLNDVAQQNFGVAVPLYVSHSASRVPLVGTNIEYFTVRDLTINEGRSFAVLGEVVAGAQIARDFRLRPGDKIRSDMKNLYNISGAYPMILEIVGVLEPSGEHDDQALFTDVKTTWALDGFFHGHDEVTVENALPSTTSEDENLEATAAIFMFPEINQRNRNQFHMHGDQSELPLSSVAVFPKSQREHDILLGEMALSKLYQAVRPSQVVESILDIVLRIQQALTLYFTALIVTTLAFFALVLSLSLQLRRSELQLMKRIGGSQRTIAAMVAAEILLVSVLAAGLSGGMVYGTIVLLQQMIS